MPIDKLTVEEDGKSQDVIIAMTPEEAKDTSYRKYLAEGTIEKTKSQLKKKPPREKSKLSEVEQVEAIKDLKAYRERKKKDINPRYFSVDYTS